MRHWNATISTPARRERDRRSGESVRDREKEEETEPKREIIR